MKPVEQDGQPAAVPAEVAGSGARPGAGPEPAPGTAAAPGMVDFDKYRRFGAYHWQLVRTHADYLRRVETVCAHVRARDRVLDLGCGDGAYLYFVAPRCRQVTGVDGDEHAIRCASQELERNAVANFALIRSTFRDLPLHLPTDARFDLIYSMDCIEHLIDPRELLDLADRLLAPHGRVLIGTPLFVSAAAVSSYHVKEYTQPELEALLEPRYEKLGEHWLPAPVPNSKELPPRFYVFHGRRRPGWKPWRRSTRAVRRASERIARFRLPDAPRSS